MSNTFYVNLFHNDFFRFSGFKKDLENAEDGGKRPVIMPMSTNLIKSMGRTAVRFPYALDEDKNIKTFDVGQYTIAVLKPTPEVPGLTEKDYKDSRYYRLMGADQERLEELQEKVENKDDEIGVLEKKIRELKEEEEEQGKSSSNTGGRTGVCPQCGSSHAETSWQNNSGLCPSCNRVEMSNPEVTWK